PRPPIAAAKSRPPVAAPPPVVEPPEPTLDESRRPPLPTDESPEAFMGERTLTGPQAAPFRNTAPLPVGDPTTPDGPALPPDIPDALSDHAGLAAVPTTTSGPFRAPSLLSDEAHPPIDDEPTPRAPREVSGVRSAGG